MAPAPSKVWQHFKKLDNFGARCLICSKVVSNCGNTSNYHKHLRVNHSILLTGNASVSQNKLPTSPAKKRKRSSGSPVIHTTPKSEQPKLMETIKKQLSFQSK